MSSKSLVINCGASHVAAAVFTSANGKLTLEELDTRDLRYDVTKEEAWLPAVRDGLIDLSRASSRFRGKATFILPGYQLLIKPIKVPHVETSKQAQIIAFEAQNNIPFPLAEAVWGSQVVADDGIETEVLLAAQKAEAANRFCGLMTMIGFEPVSLQPSSLLDYNAYKLVHPDDAEDTLIINIGARSTNLTFVSPAGLFIRNVNLGGNTFTQMLADATGKAFNAAEELKVSFYSGATSFEADDPAVGPLQARALDFMKRLSQNLTQSIISYRRSTNRAAPARILLTGRGSLLTGLPEFLSDAQKVSVDYFNPTSTLAVGARVEKGVLDSLYYQISEVVGDAARLTKPDAMGVNLLPPVIRAQQKFQRQQPFLIVAGVLLALAPMPMLYRYFSQVSIIKAEAKAWNDRTDTLASLAKARQKYADEANATSRQIANYQNLYDSRFNWIIFFSQLQAALVDIKDVWLNSLEVQREVSKAPASADAAADQSASAAPAQITNYRLNVKGSMLLRVDDATAEVGSVLKNKAAGRLNTLMGKFDQIKPFVKRVDPASFKLPPRSDTLPILDFEFTVIINPETPL